METQLEQRKKQILLDDLTLVILTSYLGNIKHLSWSYENEFRFTVVAIAEGMPYSPVTPKEIFIGMNCVSTYEDKIIRIG